MKTMLEILECFYTVDDVQTVLLAVLNVLQEEHIRFSLRDGRPAGVAAYALKKRLVLEGKRCQI